MRKDVVVLNELRGGSIIIVPILNNILALQWLMWNIKSNILDAYTLNFRFVSVILTYF